MQWWLIPPCIINRGADDFLETVLLNQVERLAPGGDNRDWRSSDQAD